MSSSTGEFFSGRPNDVPGNSNLPERYIPRTIEGMMPDEIAYFRLDSDCFAIDSTGRLYVDQNHEYFAYDKGDIGPNYDKGEPDEEMPKITWIGLMRAYVQAEGGHVIDTYIADVREVDPGEIEMIDDDEFLAEFMPVLGIISEDDDGNLSYGCANSDRLTSATIGAAEILARTMDETLVWHNPDFPPAAKEVGEVIVSESAADSAPETQEVEMASVTELKPTERLPKKHNPKKSTKNPATELPKDKDEPRVDES